MWKLFFINLTFQNWSWHIKIRPVGYVTSPFTLEIFFLTLADIWVLIRLVSAVSVAITHTFRCYQMKIVCTVAKFWFITPIRTILMAIAE
jgi:hypothetical protein